VVVNIERLLPEAGVAHRGLGLNFRMSGHPTGGIRESLMPDNPWLAWTPPRRTAANLRDFHSRPEVWPFPGLRRSGQSRPIGSHTGRVSRRTRDRACF